MKAITTMLISATLVALVATAASAQSSPYRSAAYYNQGMQYFAYDPVRTFWDEQDRGRP